MTIADILHTIEAVAPLTSQENWDNSGLQIGDLNSEAVGALLCTDVTEVVVREAIAKKRNLIISHHPLLFHGLKTIQGTSEVERCVMLAIQHGIGIYSSHTSMDNYLHGVSGWMATKLGIREYELLAPSGENTGLGVVGNLDHAFPFDQLLTHIKSVFHAPMVKYTEPKSHIVQRIALCGGAGSEFMKIAAAKKADVFISADFRYHDFMRAKDIIGVVDIGHYESEQYTKEIFYTLIKKTYCDFVVDFAENDQSAYKIA